MCCRMLYNTTNMFNTNANCDDLSISEHVSHSRSHFIMNINLNQCCWENRRITQYNQLVSYHKANSLRSSAVSVPLPVPPPVGIHKVTWTITIYGLSAIYHWYMGNIYVSMVRSQFLQAVLEHISDKALCEWN